MDILDIKVQHCMGEKGRRQSNCQENLIPTHIDVLSVSTDFAKDCSILSRCQGTKKFGSDSPGLVDFVVKLVEFILHLPDGQVKVFEKFFL